MNKPEIKKRAIEEEVLKDDKISAKQFCLDVKLKNDEDINSLINDIVKLIENRGNEVLTPNDLINICDVSEHYQDIA